jgi:hypothetical protein
MSTKRNATPKEIRIARDALTRKKDRHLYVEHITPRKNYLDTIGKICFIISCLFCLAAYIQYG